MSTPPVKKVSDGSSRGDDAYERQFRFFTPAKRRATLYEDVTIDTQPSIHRHMDRGWLVSFEDGRGTWDASSTKLRSGDWYRFRDPGEVWERPFYQVGARYEADIDDAVANANRDGLFEDFSPEWVEFLRHNLQVPAFAEHGVWLGTASAGRNALSDGITRAIVFEAALKQRFAQSLVLYGMDLEPHFGDMGLAGPKQRWLEHPSWQPTRAFVEKLHATTDWAEVIVAANVCYEPLIGTMIRRELMMRAATVNGDTVTPVVARVAQLEWQWIAEWTQALLKMLFEDEEHGAHNHSVVTGWLAEWLPEAEAATEALGGVIDELPVSFDHGDAIGRIRRDAATYHEGLGVSSHKAAA